MATGTVKWFDPKKGYGFLTSPEVEGDVFVHYSGIAGKGYKRLFDGEVVTFDLVPAHKGDGQQAANVVVTEPSPKRRKGAVAEAATAQV